MRIEELCLVFYGLRDRHSLINVELGTAFDTKVAKLERVDGALKQFYGVCASVHQVNLCYDSDRTISFWIDLSC